jgi:Flp pilus assembly pilin Flp
MLVLYLSILNWLQNEEGQDLAEYGLLLGFLAVVVMIALATFGYYLLFFWGMMADTFAAWSAAGVG